MASSLTSPLLLLVISTVCLPPTCYKDACWIWGWVIQGGLISRAGAPGGLNPPQPSVQGVPKAAAPQRWGERLWKIPNLHMPLTSEPRPLQPGLGIIPGTCTLMTVSGYGRRRPLVEGPRALKASVRVSQPGPSSCPPSGALGAPSSVISAALLRHAPSWEHSSPW